MREEKRREVQVRRGREEKLWLGKVGIQYVSLSLLQREKSGMIEAGETNKLTVDFVTQYERNRQTDAYMSKRIRRKTRRDRGMHTPSSHASYLCEHSGMVDGLSGQQAHVRTAVTQTSAEPFLPVHTWHEACLVPPHLHTPMN
jgi:hypothetical protein